MRCMEVALGSSRPQQTWWRNTRLLCRKENGLQLRTLRDHDRSAFYARRLTIESAKSVAPLRKINR
jgi:hypothetical protein